MGLIELRTDLDAEDVRHNLFVKARKVTVYCPQCNRKTLRKGSKYAGCNSVVIWACVHNLRPTRGRGRWNYDPKKTPPCNLVIMRTDGTDAEVKDYGGVLGALADIDVPDIEKYLTRTPSGFRAKGLEVLYEGAHLDLIRGAGEDGVGAYILWKHYTYDSTALEVSKAYTHHAAAGFIKFHGFTVNQLLKRTPVQIWSKEKSNTEGNEEVFKAKSCGKRLRQKLVKFAKVLDQNAGRILDICEKERDRWCREKAEFWRAVKDHVGVNEVEHTGITYYCGETKTAIISVGRVNTKGAALLSELLAMPISLPVLQNMDIGSSRQSPQDVMKIEEVLGVKFRHDVSRLVGWGKYNLDMVKDIAKIVEENQ